MERRKAAQQYVRDDTSCPNVNFEAVSVIEERTPGVREAKHVRENFHIDYGTFFPHLPRRMLQ